MKKILLFLAVCVISACTKTPAHTFGASGGTASPIIPASWTVPAWFIDPANSSGTASDNNNCTTSATACLTWHQINDVRWGCQGSPRACPRLQQNTAIEFMSSQSVNTDPVYFYPTIENSAVVQIFGPLGVSQQVASGVLSNVTAKNRSTPQLLLAQSGATAPGQFVVNSTHPSRAWTYKLSSGSIYSMTEPAVAATVPSASPCGAGVDTWTNGDSVIAYQPVAVNIVGIEPITALVNAGSSNTFVYVYNVAIQTTGAPTAFDVSKFSMTELIESSDRKYIYSSGVYYSGVLPAYCNVWANNGALGGPVNTSITYNAGAYGVSGQSNSVMFASFKNDVIIAGNVFVAGAGVPGATLGSGGGPAYIDTGKTLTVASAFAGNSGIWWGPGTIDVTGQGHFVYTAPSATNLIVASLKLNDGTTGHSVFTLANVDTPCGGITLTTTNLDAASSATCATTGFGGIAFNPGGGSFGTAN